MARKSKKNKKEVKANKEKFRREVYGRDISMK